MLEVHRGKRPSTGTLWEVFPRKAYYKWIKDPPKSIVVEHYGKKLTAMLNKIGNRASPKSIVEQRQSDY